MTGDGRAEPLVAVVCGVPLLSEAVTDALQGIAGVRSFPAGRGDMAGLLRALAPDAIVVDSEADAREAEVFASEADLPLVHVSLRDQTLRTLEDGRWQQTERAISPESIRNAVVGGIYGKERAR